MPEANGRDIEVGPDQYGMPLRNLQFFQVLWAPRPDRFLIFFEEWTVSKLGGNLNHGIVTNLMQYCNFFVFGVDDFDQFFFGLLAIEILTSFRMAEQVQHCLFVAYITTTVLRIGI